MQTFQEDEERRFLGTDYTSAEHDSADPAPLDMVSQAGTGTD